MYSKQNSNRCVFPGPLTLLQYRSVLFTEPPDALCITEAPYVAPEDTNFHACRLAGRRFRQMLQLVQTSALLLSCLALHRPVAVRASLLPCNASAWICTALCCLTLLSASRRAMPP